MRYTIVRFASELQLQRSEEESSVHAVRSSVFASILVMATGCVDPGDVTTSATDQSLTASDPLFSLQTWHYNEANLPNAWNTTTGSASTIVAMVDSGTMPHPDLDAKWVAGYDFFAGDANPHDDGWYHHGIHTAGIVAAMTNNGIGGAGVCWSCMLMPLRVLSVGAPGNTDTPTVEARAIRNAIGQAVADGFGHTAPAPAQPASVINSSLGNTKLTACPADVQSALDAAFNAGVVVVAAAGNNDDGDTTSTHYMWENCNHVIVVTAVQESGAPEAYSITGAGVTLAAPGGTAIAGGDGHGALIGCTDPMETRGDGTHGVVSTWVTSQGVACYRHWAGTSMAAPHVSGIAALMKSRNPALTADQATRILKGTARAISCGAACGAGLVDASEAVRAALVTATVDCSSTGGGRFSCIFDDVTGLSPLTVQWTAAANAGLNAPTNSVNGVTGRCSVGLSSTVTVTVTDQLGRSLTKNRSFVCTNIVP